MAQWLYFSIVNSPTCFMKHFFTLALFLVIASASAQQRCSVPASAVVYQQNINQISIMRGDVGRQQRAEEFVTRNCVSSQQIKGIAMLFTSDSIRYEFCRTAYQTVTDAGNFFVVYDAFKSFSWSIRLYDFVFRNPVQTGLQIVEPAPAASAPVYPAWNYPDTARVTGSKGCAGPVISESAFTLIAGNVFRQPTDESKIVAIESASANNCLGMAQMMKLASMLSGDDNRMRVMKNGFAHVYDQEHYPSATALFSTQVKMDEWKNFCILYLTPPCVVTNAEFVPLMAQIREKRFPDEKLALVKLLAKDRCFNVAQLAQIGDEFAFDDNRMEIFKLCYAKCPDKQNYYLLVDKLTFSTDKDELRRFINAGGK
jgi:hypothetical protein